MDILSFLAVSAFLSCVAPLCSGIYVIYKSGINGRVSEEAAIYLVFWLVCIIIPLVNIVISITFAIKLLKKD